MSWRPSGRGRGSWGLARSRTASRAWDGTAIIAPDCGSAIAKARTLRRICTIGEGSPLAPSAFGCGPVDKRPVAWILAMPVRRPGKHALAFVLITVLIDMVGIGLIIPVLPDIIEKLGGVDVSGAATIGGWMIVAYSLMQFLFGPIIGNLSDAYGRRPVLLLSVAGLGVDYILTGAAPSLVWLFAGRLFAGICGASYPPATAYIADITAPAE